MMTTNRIKKVQKKLLLLGLDALFVSNPANVYYLSTFRPLQYKQVQPLDDPEGFLLITKNAVFLFTDARYADAAKKVAGITFKEIPYPASSLAIAKLLNSLAKKNSIIGFETDSLIYSDFFTLSQELNSQSVDASSAVSDLRLIKDESELKLLTQAAEITTAGFEYALTKIKRGITEKQLAFEITTFFLKEAEGNSFDPIVAFGAGSAIPHYETSNVALTQKGILLIDLGCVYKGYCGDMTRTVFIGKAGAKFKKVYNLVLNAQEKALTKISAGQTGTQADGIARKVISDAGYGKYFTHGTGHGIGLAIHEAPSLRSTSSQVLQNGMFFSVEPGVYIPTWGGIRIEDVGYLKGDKLINVTKCDKSLRELKI